MTHFNGDRWDEFIEKGGVDKLQVSQYVVYKTV